MRNIFGFAENPEQVRSVIERLISSGFSDGDISTFNLNRNVDIETDMPESEVEGNILVRVCASSAEDAKRAKEIMIEEGLNEVSSTNGKK